MYLPAIDYFKLTICKMRYTTLIVGDVCKTKIYGFLRTSGSGSPNFNPNLVISVQEFFELYISKPYRSGRVCKLVFIKFWKILFLKNATITILSCEFCHLMIV